MAKKKTNSKSEENAAKEAEERARLEDAKAKAEDKLDIAEQAQAAQFDKAILTVSAALFGLSIGIFNVIQQPPVWVFCLVVSWMFICTSILATLLSFLTSQEAIRHNRNVIRGYVQSKPPPQWTNYLNWVSYILFALGLFFFCFFAGANMSGNERNQRFPSGVARPSQGPVTNGYQPSSINIDVDVSPGNGAGDASSDTAPTQMPTTQGRDSTNE